MQALIEGHRLQWLDYQSANNLQHQLAIAAATG
jgi:hypothetical protein